MEELHFEEVPDDVDIDETIQHPAPDELNLLCLDDPDLIQKLDERWADGSPTMPWSELRREKF